MKYFAICEECGSCEWVDYELDIDFDENVDEDVDLSKTIINSLNEQGNINCHNSVAIAQVLEFNFLICADCENQLRAIPFDRVDEDTRIKVYNMNEEERIDWVKSHQIVEKLIKDEKKVTKK